METKRTHIVIITIMIIIAVAAILLLHFFPKKSLDDAMYNQYVATQNISLPDGKKVISLTATKRQTHSKLGAQLTNLTTVIKENLQYPEHDGVYVQDTIRHSPAQTAGILPGDIIININNTATPDIFPTINLIACLHAGETYPVTVFRQGKYLVYPVTITNQI